jgi:hypothetical protein
MLLILWRSSQFGSPDQLPVFKLNRMFNFRYPDTMSIGWSIWIGRAYPSDVRI